MAKLSEERPLFHSEADFQFALALMIKEHYQEKYKDKEIEIRLERCVVIEKDKKGKPRSWYIDIWVELGGKIYPIELKYKTRGQEDKMQEVKDEKYRLKNQGANDVGRFDYLWDIHRIEQISKLAKSDEVKFREEVGEEFGEGYAIILTNDHLYWKPPTNEPNTSCKDFRIHEGETIEGKMRWTELRGDEEVKREKNNKKYKAPGKKRSRDEEIELKGKYTITWTDYSELEGDGNKKDGTILKYTIATIKK